MAHHRPVIAYLSSQNTIPVSPDRREDAFEHDLQIGYLGQGLHYVGRGIEPVRWDAPDVDWSRYEAAVIGTTWDYTARADAFVAALEVIAQKTCVLNPVSLVRWNMQKIYLQSLADKGVATIPTLWLDAPEESACRTAFDRFDTDTIIIKPQVGAGAWRQVKLHRHDAMPAADALPLGATMVQPYLSGIADEGEYSLLFFNRRFSHAVVKKAAQGEYRIQSSYGGTDMPYQPSSADIDVASTVLAAVPGNLLYARVDMVRGDDGQLKLIELEIIEPYLYPLHAPEMGHAYARAYCELIGC